MSYTVDDTTYAATPGKIPISLRKFLDYFEVKGVKKLIYHLILMLPKSFLFTFLKNNTIINHWISVIEHFKFGCVNPAIILNEEKGLVAVFTNLTNFGSDPTPVIKIYKEKLQLIQGEISNGQRVSNVALYYRNPKQLDAKAWIDFDPKVPDCFTDDSLICTQSMNRLKANSWKCLEIGLTQLKDKEKLGLHHLDLDKELVNSSY